MGSLHSRAQWPLERHRKQRPLGHAGGDGHTMQVRRREVAEGDECRPVTRRVSARHTGAADDSSRLKHPRQSAQPGRAEGAFGADLMAPSPMARGVGAEGPTSGLVTTGGGWTLGTQVRVAWAVGAATGHHRMRIAAGHRAPRRGHQGQSRSSGCCFGGGPCRAGGDAGRQSWGRCRGKIGHRVEHYF